METTYSDVLEQALDDRLDLSSRLDVYIVDSGWDSVAHRVLNRSLDLFKSYLRIHNLYILSTEQSVQLLTEHSDLLGKDPVILVVDPLARALNNPSGYGARVVLGLIEDEHRVEWLIKMFLRVVNTHIKTLDIAHTFREHNHKEGVKGAVEIIVESFGH